MTTMVSPHDTSTRCTPVGNRARSAAAVGFGGEVCATSGRAGLGDGIAERLRDLVDHRRVEEHPGLARELLDAQRGVEHRLALDLLLEHHDAVQQPLGPRRAAGY